MRQSTTDVGNTAEGPGDPAIQGAGGTPPEATPASGNQPWRPLSSGQWGIALQQQMAADSPIFNVPAALEIVGPLNLDALTASLTEIVHRHDVLRSRLVYRNGTFTQIVDPPGPAEILVHDVRHVSAADRVSAARALLDSESARPFDLFSEHGLRLMLVALDDDRHVFFWNLHHIVCDGWSKSVFARELSLLYAGRSADLPELTVHYGDYVHHERAVDAKLLSRHLAYWERQLADVHTTVGVPTDHPRRTASSPRGTEIAFTVDAAIRQRLIQVSRQNGATMFMVLHAAMAALLFHINGRSDVVINIPYGGRPTAAFEPLIGFFVNVMAMRSQVTAEQPFDALVEQVRDTALDGFDHHLAPFQQVVERVAARHGGRVGALHQTSFAFANLPYLDVDLAGLTVHRFPLTRVDIRYELEWHLWEDDTRGGLGGRLIYRPDLFAEGTAAAFVSAYQTLLAAVAVGPHRTVKDLVDGLEQLAAVRPDGVAPVGRPADQPSAPPAMPDHRAPGEASASPGTETELAVYDIWVGLLHQDEIDVHDEFFNIGGNSLLVALMIAQIRDVFGVSLTIRQVVQQPTIAAIAAAIVAIPANGPGQIAEGGSHR